MMKTGLRRQLIAVLVSVVTCCALTGAQAQADRFADYDPDGRSSLDHGAFAQILSEHVTVKAPGVTRVDYAALGADGAAALERYIATLSGIDPTTLTREAAFAYWVNLYNAVTLDVVLEHYPVESIRDIRFGLGLRPGPWREELVTVNGAALSLDNIEHDILREYWDEPRVHVAVNCASVGCPALRAAPFTADRLEAQLDDAARAFVNSGRAAYLEGSRLTVSSLFKWYEEDFGDSEAGVIDWLSHYADEDLAASLERSDGIDAYAYDWSLNDTGKESR